MLAHQQNHEISTYPTLKTAEQGFGDTAGLPPAAISSPSRPQLKRSDSVADKRKASILLESTRDFCRLNRPDDDQCTRFKEFFYQFICKLSLADKRIVSAMLARLDYTPRPIALYLAMGKIEIAAPFLLFSPVLGEADLTAIAEKMGADHARVIERRRGDKSRSIAQTSRTAFLHESKPKVQSKQPVSSNAVRENPEILKAEFISSPAANPGKKDEWLSSEEIIALASVGGRLGQSKSRQIDATKAKSPDTSKRPDPVPLLPVSVEIFIKHARNLDRNAFAIEASKASGMDVKSISPLVSAITGDELVYFIKALAIPAPKDMQLLLMLAPRFGRSAEIFRKANSLFSKLDTGICRMIFNKIGARFEIPGVPKPTQITGSRRDPEFASAVRARQAELLGSRATLTPASRARNFFGRKTT